MWRTYVLQIGVSSPYLPFTKVVDNSHIPNHDRCILAFSLVSLCNPLPIMTINNFNSDLLTAAILFYTLIAGIASIR